MIRELREERGVEKTLAHNARQGRSGHGTPTFGGLTPDSGASGDESVAKARAHRDKLLSFQAQNAQRTKIHDEAADFDMGNSLKGAQWLSPVQRATALKKQQKYLRELEEANKPEWEREKTVVSLGFRGGKLVKTYGKQRAERKEAVDGDGDGDGDDEVEKEGEGESARVTASGAGKFSNNPLLKVGELIRPIWKPQDEPADGDGKGKGKEEASRRERKSVWRRVQDDHEDNEQWILDGGLRGYGTETRVMEDGSQQECG
jgi:hexokinase